MRVSRMHTLPTWPNTVAGLHGEEGAVQAAELLHRCLLGWVVRRGQSSVACRARSRAPAPSAASQSSTCPAVHSGTSSWGTCPTPSATSNRHAGMRGGRRAGGRDRHEAVLVAVQQQHRRRDAAEHLPVGAAAGQQGEQGPRGHEELRVDVGVAVPLMRQLDVLAQHLRRDPAGIGAAQPEHVHGGLLGGARAPAPVEQRPAERRHGVEAEGEGDQRVRPRPDAGGQRGVHEHQAGDRLRVRRSACMAAIRPPIELPTTIAGVPATSVRNRCSSCWLASTDVGSVPPWVRPKPARSSARTRQVGVSSGAMAAQFSSEPPRPCTRTSRGPSAGAAVVDEVHPPAAQVRPLRRRLGKAVPRARRRRRSAGRPCAELMRRP